MNPQSATPLRQRWMAVLAHSQPRELAERYAALNLNPDYELLRQAETGLVQIQGRMGGSGNPFFAGDATLTRAAIRLGSGTCGYSWVLGRDSQHAERCALVDALLQESAHHATLMETLINPLEASRDARLRERQRKVAASRVDFFTLVRGDNA
jgi:alpha-D-ribose 1-methylphosphonate 5-triphosphate synthase subunit PhnG